MQPRRVCVVWFWNQMYKTIVSAGAMNYPVTSMIL